MTHIISTNEFLKELNNTYFNVEDENNICPIDSLPFCENAITLPCKHKFNYISLFNYIYSIKKIPNRNNIIKLKINEVQCPMCRAISNQLLPFIPHKNIKKRETGITSPSKYCMSHKTCCKIITCGKNKGKICGKPGYHTNNGDICEMHEQRLRKKKASPSKSLHHSNMITDKIWKFHTIPSLKNILRKNNLTVGGNKMELIDRLLNNNIVITT
jgi:hypothetical protein